MPDFFYRTEDIRPEEINNYFVETSQDRSVVNALKGVNPVILVGSRGSGKTFLLRVAEYELRQQFQSEKVFPVYVSFSKSSLIHSSDPNQFQHWMLARLCSRIVRSLRLSGFVSVFPASISVLTGEDSSLSMPKTKIEVITDAFEESWKNPGSDINFLGLPSIDAFKDAIEDLCASLKIQRFVILIDEAAHIFLPEQQRQFFTLFRDLRSPYLTCKAAVYPGVTAFGSTFQPVHDASFLTLDRDFLASDFLKNMREIVEKQADSAFLTNVARRGENFALLAYASSGNPRVLLKTLSRAPSVNSQQVNETIRAYYRDDVWAEHSTLSEKYTGHQQLIDWGRKFIEDEVLSELQKKNVQYLQDEKNSTCFFWIHKDAPEQVKEALRLLAYTGIVMEHSKGIKATRSEIGTRYAVNLGCLFAQESTPTTTAFRIAKSLTPKRMTEYGANHSAFKDLMSLSSEFSQPDMSIILIEQMKKSIESLDLTSWQVDRLHSIGINTIKDILLASEVKLQEAYYVGEKRSRRMKNIALAAVYEYLSG